MIAVIDGQGGGIGKMIVDKLQNGLSSYTPLYTLRVLGTNAAATSNMLRAGASDGATGENAIICNAKKADIIVGVIGITIPNSILGELTPAMAEAISNSDAKKILIPVNKCNTVVAIPAEFTLCQCIEKSIELVKEEMKLQFPNIKEV